MNPAADATITGNWTFTGTTTFAGAVVASGQVRAASGSAAAPAYSFSTRLGTGFWIDDSLGGQDAYLVASIDGTGVVSIRGAGGNGLSVIGAPISFSTALGVTDLYFTRKAAATLRLGLADAASPVAQTLTVQGVVAGTSDTAGANFTIDLSQSTGNGAGGSLIVRGTAAGGAGSSQNAYATLLTLTAAGKMTLAGEAEIDGALNHDGSTVGFYGTAPIAQQTGVGVDAASIHAALVALGLITA